MEPRETPRTRQWRWPREPEWLQGLRDQTTAPVESQALGLPSAVIDNEDLRRAAIARPDDDRPRQAYADWLSAQDHEFAQLLGRFISAQLRVAQAFRSDRRASVTAHLRWRGDAAHVSMPQFRAGDVLRPWFLDSVIALQSMGLVGWPQVYRGFIERIGVRASRFLEIADELFQLAPIRYLVVVDVPAAVDQLAASPHLARIRSLSLPCYTPDDELTDATLQRLVASPNLGHLAHLRLVHQHRLTSAAYERIVNAPTLPQLSSFEVYEPRYRWDHLEPCGRDPMGRFNRMIAYDTPLRSQRSKEWIVALEHAMGYVPCVHPEEHYGCGLVDMEAVVEHPIALDPQIMSRRGRSVSRRRHRRVWR
jgi:uncharacterized protein (TIGR02996 family)